MTVEGLQNYLGVKLPVLLNAQQFFRLLRSVFALVFLATLVIHLLAEQVIEPLSMLTHAITIGLVYVVAVGIACATLYTIRSLANDVRAWHVWIASLASFVLGYYFLPLDDLMPLLPGVVTNDPVGEMRISQLLPVWFLLTYIFVQPYLNEGLRLELSRLRDTNSLLEQHRTSDPPARKTLVHFVSGRTEFTLDAEAIRNIVVEDHYCYVHYKDGDAYAKRDLAMPLRDVRALLPDGFLLVHRSHVVNLKHIKSIRRRDRKIRVVLDSDYEVPVSRHRLEEVLPLVRTQVK